MISPAAIGTHRYCRNQGHLHTYAHFCNHRHYGNWINMLSMAGACWFYIDISPFISFHNELDRNELFNWWTKTASAEKRFLFRLVSNDSLWTNKWNYFLIDWSVKVVMNNPLGLLSSKQIFSREKKTRKSTIYPTCSICTVHTCSYRNHMNNQNKQKKKHRVCLLSRLIELTRIW